MFGRKKHFEIEETERRSGTMLMLRALPSLGIGVIGSNLIGAGILFVLMAWVIPIPDVANPDRVRVVNLIMLASYVSLAVISGIVYTWRDVRPIRRWLLDDRPPTAEEQILALLAPSRLGWRLVTRWGLGVILFTIFNAVYYLPNLALVIAIAGLFTAMGTCSFSYLVAERSTREIARRALEDGPRTPPALPGVTARVMATWLLSTGMPIIGVVLISAGVTLGILSDNTSQQRLATMIICGVALFIGVQAMFMVSRSIADPIKSVRHGIDRLAGGDLSVEVPVFDASEVGLLQRGFNEMVEGLRERERVRDLFGRHVGEDVAEQALLVGAELGGEVRDVAVVFVDVIGSTELAVSMPAEELVDLLNRFFAVVIECVDNHGGAINKFEGDAALCVFGAPAELDDAAGAALGAARDMGRMLAREIPEFGVGVGVSAGPVVAGNVGSAERHEYTVIGDPVNEAARLTEIAKSVEGGVVASGAVLSRAGEREAARWKLNGATTLRGRNQETELAVPT
jgi:adenylate cyclase